MKIDFTGKRALVTGAGKGIGRVIAKHLHDLNADVIAVTRSAEDLETLKQEIDCETIAVDLSDVDATHAAIEGEGDVDLLVNNAGIAILQSFLDTTPEAFDKTMAVNVRAAMVISQIVVRNMLDRGVAGAIVNVSSQTSVRGLQDHTAYCVSKGGLDQLTRVMALELGEHGIRVNSVNPTVVMTPMGKRAWSDPAKADPMRARIPLDRFAEPEEVADAVAYLLSDHASMIHGVMLPIEGGFYVT